MGLGRQHGRGRQGRGDRQRHRRRPPGGRRPGRVRRDRRGRTARSRSTRSRTETTSATVRRARGSSGASAPDCLLTSVKVLGAEHDRSRRGVRRRPALGDRERHAGLQPQPRDDEARLLRRSCTSWSTRRTSPTSCSSPRRTTMPLPSFPSTYSSVISVASHDVRDAEVYYCNPQPPVEFGALGIDVRVAWRDGEWITATGNSFATPHIAGLVTRMLAQAPRPERRAREGDPPRARRQRGREAPRIARRAVA